MKWRRGKRCPGCKRRSPLSMWRARLIRMYLGNGRGLFACPHCGWRVTISWDRMAKDAPWGEMGRRTD